MKNRQPSRDWLRRMLRALKFIQRADGYGWANDGNLHKSLLSRGLVEELGSFMRCRITEAGKQFLAEHKDEIL